MLLYVTKSDCSQKPKVHDIRPIENNLRFAFQFRIGGYAKLMIPNIKDN